MSTREAGSTVGQARRRRHGMAVAAVLVLLLVSMVLLAGCSVGVGLDTKVNEDGSGTVSVRLAADKALQDTLSAAAESSGLGSLTDGLEGLGYLEGLLGELGQLDDLNGLGDLLEGLGGLEGLLDGIDGLDGLADKLGGLDGLLEEFGGLEGLLEELGGLGDLGGSGDLDLPENLPENLPGIIPGSVDELFDMIVGELTGGWQTERGEDGDGTKWMKLTHAFADPAELEELLESSALASIINVDTFTLTQDEGFFGTTTKFAATADVDSAMSRFGDAAYGIPMDLVADVIVVENRLTLPGSIRDNNADDVQGNTLIWKIGSKGSEQMYAESIAYNWAAIIGVIVAGGIVIGALVVILVLLLLRRRRPPEPEQAQPGQYPYGPTPTIVSPNQTSALPPTGAYNQASALPPGGRAPQVAAAPDANRPELTQASRLALPAAPPPVQTGMSVAANGRPGPSIT